MKKIIKLHRHWYDNPKNKDGTDKPNEFLGEFEIEQESTDDYCFQTIGEKNGKKYKIYGQEVSALTDKYNAGTKIFIEEVQ